jgi:hypothetical protein
VPRSRHNTSILVTVRAAATVRRNDEATTEMANIPQKTKDATEEALNAIQEALNIRPAEPKFGTSIDYPANPDPLASSTTQAPSGELFTQDGPPGAWPAGESTPRRAANDDRAGIGQILQTLRHRSSRTPYIAAGVAGLVWAAVGIVSLYAIDMQSVFGTAHVGFAGMIAISAAICAPVVLFFCARPYVQSRPRHACGRRVGG